MFAITTAPIAKAIAAQTKTRRLTKGYTGSTPPGKSEAQAQMGPVGALHSQCCVYDREHHDVRNRDDGLTSERVVANPGFCKQDDQHQRVDRFFATLAGGPHIGKISSRG